MGSARDEELFMQTQLYNPTSTQMQEGEGDGDDMYLELEKAITERKCRIIQKKEKLRLIINDIKKQNEKLKSALNEQKCLKKEIEEVSNQKNVRVQNIKNLQESRATLETTLCELNNKVSLEKAETKRKKDEFDAAIKDAHETWESYKEKYENFPLAKKLRSVMIEIKKVEIAKKQAEMDIDDFKRKTRLKHDIAEKRFHLSVVKLAEHYKLYQKKIEEQKELQEKIKEMKKLISDIKSGKTTNNQLGSSQVSARPGSRDEYHGVQSPPEIVRFTVLDDVQMALSPPSTSERESSRERKLFSWDNLLSSTGFLGFSKKPAEKSAPDKQTPASTIHNLREESQKTKTPYGSKIVGPTLNLKTLLRNVSSSSQKKPEMNVGNKRAIGIVTQSEVNTEERPPIKKASNAIPQSTKCSDTGLTKANHSVASEEPSQVQQDLANENKENTYPRIYKSSSSIKSYMPSLVGAKPTVTPTNSRSTSQNLMNILSLQGNQKKAYASQRKEVHELAKTNQTASANNPTFSQRGQQESFNEANRNTDRQNQFEDIPILLEPGSPAPDLIPVETNAQQSSQGNISQTNSPINFNLSGGSEFISPADVDEATKVVYERMEQDYSRGSTMAIQKAASENRVVRSQYFADSHSLNTPPGNSEDYQSPIEQLFSPPVSSQPLMDTDYGNNSQLMTNIASPPPGAVGGSFQTSNTSFFNFMPGASKGSSNKSFLDFF